MTRHVSAATPAADKRVQTVTAARSQVDSSSRLITVCWMLILIVTAIAYGPGLAGPFVFDDLRVVRQADWSTLGQASGWSSTARPLLTLSLLWNRALVGETPLSYRLINVIGHLLAGSLLRRLLVLIARRSDQLRGAEPAASAASQAAVEWWALLVAGVWLLHPLQVQSVTYLTQRSEAWASLCYLAAGLVWLSCAWKSPPESQPAGFFNRFDLVWQLLTVLLLGLGAGFKPILLSAPIVWGGFDRLGSAETWPAFLKRRTLVIAGSALVTCWLLAPTVANLLARTPGSAVSQSRQPSATSALEPALETPMEPNPPAITTAGRGPSAGLGYLGVTPWEYLRTQPAAVLCYLRLIFWPQDLCLDRGWTVASPATAVWTTLLLASLIAAISWAVRDRPLARWGVLASGLVLVPSSSIIPIRDLCVDHRAYLMSAGVIALASALLLKRLRTQVSAAPTGAIRSGNAYAIAVIAVPLLVTLGWRTTERNRDFGSERRLWEQTIAVATEFARPRSLLAQTLSRNPADLDIALEQAALAVQLAETRIERPRAEPWELASYYDLLARLLQKTGQFSAAEVSYRKATDYDPAFVEAWSNLGVLYLQQKRWDDSDRALRRSLELQPNQADGWINLGLLEMNRDRLDEARLAWQAVIRLRPSDSQAWFNYAAVLDRLNDPAASTAYERVLALRPDHPRAGRDWGYWLLRHGQRDQVAAILPELLRQNPLDHRNWLLFADLAAARGDSEAQREALSQAQAVCPRDHKDHDAIRRRLDALGSQPAGE